MVSVYPNLTSEIAKQNVKKKEIAEVLGISNKAFYNKMCGYVSFTYDEAYKISETFFPNIDIKVLFKRL